MSKTQLVLDLARDLRQLAGSIEALADSLTTGEAPPVRPQPESIRPEPAIAIETVRAVLAEKSQNGRQPEVKALISQFGAARLTDIDPARFADLLKAAEAL